MGHRAAHRLLQKSLRKFRRVLQGGIPIYEQIKIDGIFGPITLAATNRADPLILLDELRIQAAVYYVNLILRKPGLVRFAYNWMRRAQS
jgi:lysozyme family protein